MRQLLLSARRRQKPDSRDQQRRARDRKPEDRRAVLATVFSAGRVFRRLAFGFFDLAAGLRHLTLCRSMRRGRRRSAADGARVVVGGIRRFGEPERFELAPDRVDLGRAIGQIGDLDDLIEPELLADRDAGRRAPGCVPAASDMPIRHAASRYCHAHARSPAGFSRSVPKTASSRI